MKHTKLQTQLISTVIVLCFFTGIASFSAITNEVTLFETFGWQEYYSAEKTKVEGLFESATYAYNKGFI